MRFSRVASSTLAAGDPPNPPWTARLDRPTPGVAGLAKATDAGRSGPSPKSYAVLGVPCEGVGPRESFVGTGGAGGLD